MSILLPETPASREADLKDALHQFFTNVRTFPAAALEGAHRLQAKGYKVQFNTQYVVKDQLFNLTVATASTLNPGVEFTPPPPMRVSRAEYILLKAIGDNQLPEPSLTEEQRCYYNPGRREYAAQIARARRVLWGAYAYVKQNKEEFHV